MSESDLAFLQTLSERELSELVLIPLLRAMGFREIRYLHGPDEHGKDIVFLEESPLEGNKYYAATVKATVLSGSVSSSRSIREVHYQIRQALQTPFRDTFDGRPIRIDKVFVFTPFAISQAAIASIGDELQQYPRNCVDFVDGPRLVAYLDTHLPTLIRSLPTAEGRYLSMLCQRFMDLPTLSALGAEKRLTLTEIYTGGRLTEIDRDEARLLSFATPASNTGRLRLSELLEQRRHLVVLADVGTGKTTLLQKLVVEIAAQIKGPGTRVSEMVPLFVTLASIPSSSFASQKVFMEYLEDFCRRETGTSRFHFAAASKYALLLDGFDEINLREDALEGRVDFNTVAGYVEALAATDLAAIVVTSRPTRIPELSSRFAYLSLNSFTDADVDEFLQKWFPAADDLRQTLSTRIRSSEELALFCRTPLMLTIYCLLATRFSVSELPTRRSQVYDRIVDLLLGRWDSMRNVINDFDSDVKGHILELLAYDNQMASRRRFDKWDFRRAARQVLERRGEEDNVFEYDRRITDDVLDELVFRSALVRRTEAYRFEFAHLSFQEFLCARRMARVGLTQREIGMLASEWWRNTFRFYFGLTGTLDGTPLPRQRQLRNRRVGLAFLEFLAEAEFTGLEARNRVYALLCRDLLYAAPLVPAELEICKRIGDEIVAPLKRTVSDGGFRSSIGTVKRPGPERSFGGNATNYFRVLLALRTPAAVDALLTSIDVVELLGARDLIWLLRETASLINGPAGREFFREVLKILRRQEGYIAAGTNVDDGNRKRELLRRELAELETSVKMMAGHSDVSKRDLDIVIRSIQESRKAMS